MTPRGQEILKDFEGLRLRPYTDTVGKLSIGWGRNLDDVGVSHDEAQLMFDHDIECAEDMAAVAFPWFDSLDPVRKDVVVNLCFNMGLAGFKTFKRMIEAIERQDWTGAAWELSNSKWKSQVGKERHDVLTSALADGRWPEVESIKRC